jgi:hypothetical protein
MTQEHAPDTSTMLLRVEFDDEAAAEQAAALLEQRLGELDDVADAQATMLEPRDALTAITAIGIAIAITKTSTELVVQLRRLVAEIQGLVSDIRPARRAVIESDSGEIEVDADITDDELELIAESAN